jgi:hypothetical protein
MSWRDVLKDSKQVSRNVGGLDWETEAIPEKEENNCLKQLKEYYDKAKNHPYSIDIKRRGDGRKMNSNYFKFSSVPEEVACVVVDRIKSITKEEGRGLYSGSVLNTDDNTWHYSVSYDVYETDDKTRRPRRQKRQKFRAICYGMNTNELIRFATYSENLDANIDFR